MVISKTVTVSKDSQYWDIYAHMLLWSFGPETGFTVPVEGLLI